MIERLMEPDFIAMMKCVLAMGATVAIAVFVTYKLKIFNWVTLD